MCFNNATSSISSEHVLACVRANNSRNLPIYVLCALTHVNSLFEPIGSPIACMPNSMFHPFTLWLGLQIADNTTHSYYRSHLSSPFAILNHDGTKVGHRGSVALLHHISRLAKEDGLADATRDFDMMQVLLQTWLVASLMVPCSTMQCLLVWFSASTGGCDSHEHTEFAPEQKCF